MRQIPIMALPSDDDGVPEGECPHCVRSEKIFGYLSQIMEGEQVNVAVTVCENVLADVLSRFEPDRRFKIAARILDAAAHHLSGRDS